MKIGKITAGFACAACMCFLPLLSGEDAAQSTKFEYSKEVLELDSKTGKVPVAYGLFGQVISAELSFADVTFADTEGNEYDRSHHDPVYDFNTTVWAQVIVQVMALPENTVSGAKPWTLSRFDFVLVFKDQPYKCLAVAPLDDPFSMKRENWKFTADGKEPNTGNVYRLIFPLPRRDISPDAEKDDPSAPQNFTGDTDLLLVRANEPAAKLKMPVSKIKFRFMGDKPFTTAAAILESAKGTVCGVSADKLEEALKKPEVPAQPAAENTEKPAEGTTAPADAAPAEKPAEGAAVPADADATEKPAAETPAK